MKYICNYMQLYVNVFHIILTGLLYINNLYIIINIYIWYKM